LSVFSDDCYARVLSFLAEKSAEIFIVFE